MGVTDELFKKEKNFKKLFGSLVVVIETKQIYNTPKKSYEKIKVKMKSRLDLFSEEIMAEVIDISGEIHETIPRFLRTSIPPQTFKNYYNDNPIFTLDALNIMLRYNWNKTFQEIVCNSIEENITSIKVKDEKGREIYYPIKVKDIFFER